MIKEAIEKLKAYTAGKQNVDKVEISVLQLNRIIKALEQTLEQEPNTRLVDVGQCDRKLFYKQCGGEDSLITVKSAFDMLMSLPPIIEADTTESED